MPMTQVLLKRLYDYGIHVGVLLLGLGNILLGLGLGPFAVNPFNIASGVGLIVLLLCTRSLR